MLKNKTLITAVSIFFAVFFMIPQGHSAMTSEELLQKLNELGDIIKKQQQEIERLRHELEQQKQSIKEVKEVQKETVKEEVAAQVQEKEKTWVEWIPRWVKDTKLTGDLRLRYEGLYSREDRQTDGSTTSVPTRDRFRIRARLFVDSRITEEFSTHFLICTNQDSNREATTTNQSFTDDFNDKGIYLHRAYATYMPTWLKGLELTAGKFRNTFLHTDITWDPDVNPEGIYEKYQYAGFGDFKPFIHLGQMVVNELDKESDDAALYIYQAGFDWKLGPVTWVLAASYYDWSNLHNTKYLHLSQYVKGGGNTFVKDASGNLQYRYDYNLLEGITFVRFPLGPVPAELIFDYIVNIADDVPGKNDTAYFAGFRLGSQKKKGDWGLFYKYARIERDSVLGSMNDQDFYGANRKGHKITLSYLPFDRVSLGASFFYTDPVTDWDPKSPNWSNERSREHEDRLQADFVFKF
jgi:hypothetical protein